MCQDALNLYIKRILPCVKLVSKGCVKVTSVSKGCVNVEVNSRSRKWQVTINNPAEKGFTHEMIKEQLSLFTSLVYWCMSDEVGEKGTYHTHVYIALAQASSFSTLKNRFDGAHFEIAKGTSEQNRDYVFKIGKWAKDKKQDTNLVDTHEEFGDLPVERPGARNDIADLYDMIKAGMSNYDIIELNPDYMLRIEKIERARQIIFEEKFKDKYRQLDVTYIFGVSGVGKTRGVMDKYGYQNVYRVTDYDHPFDSYKGQDVIVFDEYRSSLKIQDMLNYLDGYPLELPCRYNNKIACYTKVYIITNIPLERQYQNIQFESSETWDAFLRRIGTVVEYGVFGEEIYTLGQYLKRGENSQLDFFVG